ncbi:MAG: cystathionine gamma-synthase [Candidatus Melainabacteria bacterium RIFCSPLOWO2_02_FULL_35_15]|nr:MAG: cystathionine gamma-synthase [Candidatus Melainabacteria bacterium RIFCSPLOWO2_12_FULL_35_11]OGI13888.1 MAG: cystathionine gamma-synthase [Candidatus Melainabacteria bacterium RIFCSPLOWO2_02_FULL_35_15]
MEFETKAIHSGQEPDPTTGATITPIYQTSTFTQDALGKHKGYEYSRTGNPTRHVLETALASLEGGKYGLCFASGLAATTTVLCMLQAGDEIVAGDDLYGGTIRLFSRVFSNFNIKTNYVNGTNPKNFEDAITKNTKLIWLETPTNPMLRLCDINAVSKISKSKNIILCVDNTFASPYFQKPLDLGADIVVHSTTKYLGGHSDVVGGAIILNNKDLYEKVKFYQNAIGGTPGAFDSWLILRGIKTLAARMKKHSENAQKIAEFLEKHPKVKEVYYPGLKSHPQHKLAKEQMSGFGGMVSFKLKDGKEFTKKVIESTKLFALAESLGGVESLINFPYLMTHVGVPPEHKARLGITEDLIRLSVGIEDGNDLIDDLKKALEN